MNSKARNKLTPERAEKLVCVYQNSREIAKLRGQYDKQTVAWQYADDSGSDDEYTA